MKAEQRRALFAGIAACHEATSSWIQPSRPLYPTADSVRYMIWQLRRYELHPGKLDEYVRLWSDYVVPLREELGFVVRGGWHTPDGDVFVWLVGHEAPDGWEAVEDSYYRDPRRQRLPTNPGDYVMSSHTELLTEVRRSD